MIVTVPVGGAADWRLRVAAEDADTLRVRFRIEDVAPGQSWQLFLSDNGTRIFSATRSSGSQGEIRVNKQTRGSLGPRPHRGQRGQQRDGFDV